MKKYFIVLTCNDGMWHMENGFHNKEEAQEEKEDLRSHHKAKDIKILALPNGKNDTVITAIKNLNEGL